MSLRTQSKMEYGDFQTPSSLAEASIRALRRVLVQRPVTVMEPTCGTGTFLAEALKGFPAASILIGVEINKQYLEIATTRLNALAANHDVRLTNADFFAFDWPSLLRSIGEPLFIVGNPPWVTSSALGTLQSKNLPEKSNFQGRRGYDAITGKSNFDISEWMLLRYLDWLQDRRGVIAVLCKTAIARKILLQAWQRTLPVAGAHLFLIDAQSHFDAAVDACFLIVDLLGAGRSTECLIYKDIEAASHVRTFGYHDGLLVSDVELFIKWKHLRGTDAAYVWRSGVKHDCSKVMELEAFGDGYINGLGENIDLEEKYLYPMLKSSDIGNGEVRYGRKYMLVTQQFVGDDTSAIERIAPRTWRYLRSHEKNLSARASPIYKNRPPFSVFGVGEYSFAPWKVAISGFYKTLGFKVLHEYEGRTVVVDDTVNFLPCWSEEEARFVHELLISEPAQQFYESLVYWPDKRPITIDILRKLDLHLLSKTLDREAEYFWFARRRSDFEQEHSRGQLSLGISEKRPSKYGKHAARQRAPADEWKIGSE